MKTVLSHSVIDVLPPIRGLLDLFDSAIDFIKELACQRRILGALAFD